MLNEYKTQTYVFNDTTFLSTKGSVYFYKSPRIVNLPIFLSLNWKEVFLFALRGPNLPSYFWNTSERKYVILLHSKMILSQISCYKLLDTCSYIRISSWENLMAVIWSIWSDFHLFTQLKVANPWDLRQKTWTEA